MLSLEPNEFYVGSLAMAEPGSLMLPRKSYEEAFFIGQSEGAKFAVFLGHKHRFHSFSCVGADNWKGIVVPNVKIILDQETLVDPLEHGRIAGMLIRKQDNACVLAHPNQRFSHFFEHIQVADGLPIGSPDLQAGFLHWQIAIGSGDNQRVLLMWILGCLRPKHHNTDF